LRKSKCYSLQLNHMSAFLVINLRIIYFFTLAEYQP
jgi:hypothetical protein